MKFLAPMHERLIKTHILQDEIVALHHYEGSCMKKISLQAKLNRFMVRRISKVSHAKTVFIHLWHKAMTNTTMFDGSVDVQDLEKFRDKSCNIVINIINVTNSVLIDTRKIGITVLLVKVFKRVIFGDTM